MQIDSPRRRAHLAAVADALPDRGGRLEWSAAHLRSERQRLLRETVAFAQARSPWHRERLAAFDATTIAVADLPGLPTMTKADVMASWDRLVTDPRLNLASANVHITDKLSGLAADPYHLGEYLIFASGGSSGVRGVFVWGWQEFVEIACSAMRYQRRDERADDGGRPARLAVVEAGESVHGSVFLFSVTPDPSTEVRLLPASMPLPELVAGLNAAQPTHLTGFSSAVQALAGEALAGRLHIQPRRVSANSEPLLPEARAAARDAWGVEINNMWGCTEVGILGVECDAHEGMHLSDDLVITEFVDRHGQPVADPDRVEKLLVTSLFNRTMPIIRYELTDVAIPGDRPCTCGSVFPLIREVKGRADDVFRYGGVSVHPLVFRTPLGQHPLIEEYQVRQTPRGAEIAVVARGPLDVATLNDSLVKALAAAGMTEPKVDVRIVDAIERHKETGKLKRFIPIADRRS